MRASLRPSGEGRLAVCEALGRSEARIQCGPNILNLKDGVTSRRSAGCAARLARGEGTWMCPALGSEEQTASLPCATRNGLRAFWTSCRVRGIDQSILKRAPA
jgi:hypothetical protein